MATEMKCPSAAEIKLFAANPHTDGNAEIAAHIFACEICSVVYVDCLTDGGEAPLTDKERNSINEFVEKNCKPSNVFQKLRLWTLTHPAVPKIFGGMMSSGARSDDWRRAAAAHPRTGGLERKALADADTATITYLSYLVPDLPRGWKAVLTLPASPNISTRMDVVVKDRKQEPIDGAFTVGGMEVELQQGHGKLAYTDFLKGLKTPEAFVTFADGVRQDGALVLF